MASLHEQIVQSLESRIVNGKWPPGTRIPSELELMAEFGCARMTVNKAVMQLVRAGLVERKRRAGTVVARPKVRSAILEISEIKAEVEARGKKYSHHVLERSQRDKELRLTTLHFAGSQPFCLEQRTVFLATVPTAQLEHFVDAPPGSWLLHHVPWTDAEHSIRAESADGIVARCLALRSGDACLVIERRTWLRGEPVTHVTFHYPAQTYCVVAKFSASSRAQA
jgi:GntR family histidine utilization transcriptional repressor